MIGSDALALFQSLLPSVVVDGDEEEEEEGEERSGGSGRKLHDVDGRALTNVKICVSSRCCSDWSCYAVSAGGGPGEREDPWGVGRRNYLGVELGETRLAVVVEDEDGVDHCAWLGAGRKLCTYHTRMVGGGGGCVLVEVTRFTLHMGGGGTLMAGHSYLLITIAMLHPRANHHYLYAHTDGPTDGSHLDAHQIALQDPHELGHERLEVEDVLGADVDAVFVEGRPLDYLGAELVVDALDQTERQELSASVAVCSVRGTAGGKNTLRMVVGGMQCVSRSYSLLRTCMILAGVCSARISSAIWLINASKSGGGMGVESFTQSLSQRPVGQHLYSTSVLSAFTGNILLGVNRLEHQQRPPKVPAALLGDPRAELIAPLELLALGCVLQDLDDLLPRRRRDTHQQRTRLDGRDDVCRRVRDQDQPQVRRVLLHRPPQRGLGIASQVLGLIDDYDLEPLPRGQIHLLRLRRLLQQILDHHSVVIANVGRRDLEVVVGRYDVEFDLATGVRLEDPGIYVDLSCAPSAGGGGGGKVHSL